MNRFDAFDGSHRQVSNGESQDGSGHLTDLTDLTVNERGCTYRASVGARAHVAPLTYLPPECRQIRQIRQTTHAVVRFCFDARRQTRCQFDGSRSSGVVA